MNATESLDLLLYGLTVVGFNWLAHRIAPDFAGPTLFLMAAGGLFILLLGVLGLCGFRRRSWPIVTLSFVALLLLVQSAKAWFALRGGAVELKPVALIFSLLLFFALGQLLNLAQAERHLRLKRKQPGRGE